jgi:hypothetical protein
MRQATHGLDVLREHVESAVDDRRDVGHHALKIGRQRFDCGCRIEALDLAHARGEVRGAATNDMLVFSETDTTYSGQGGTDSLWLQGSAGQTLNLGDDLTLNSVEAIDARNGAADTLNLNLADVLGFSEDGILTVRGDAVDAINLQGAIRAADVVQNGETFASYVSDNGAQLLVSPDVQVNLEEHRCTLC